MLNEYRNSDTLSIGTPIRMPAILGYMETVGDRVRQARKEAGFTQKQLAKKVGISQSSISELEGGDTSETPAIVKIAVACKVSPYWLDAGGGPMRRMTDALAAFLALPPDMQERALELIAVVQKKRAA